MNHINIIIVVVVVVVVVFWRHHTLGDPDPYTTQEFIIFLITSNVTMLMRRRILTKRIRTRRIF